MFSTDLVPISDRFDAWQWNARQICGDCRIRFPKRSRFHGSIDARRVGELQLTRFSSSPVSFQKTPLETAASGNGSYIVITQLEGVQSYSQGNGVTVLEPGDSTVINAAVPWSSDSPSECARLYLRVPAWLMEDRLQASRLPMTRRIAGDVGLGVALFRLATSLYEQALMLNNEETAAGLGALFDILSACLGSAPAGRPSHSRELAARIENFIETHLDDPALAPPEIAAEIGVSVRHLYRLFSMNGETVSDWIRERRIQQCSNDLGDPGLCDRSITDIAFSWGFSDSAHFSRSFKKTFGISPRQFRSAALPREARHLPR
jgi:AraC family transcriptional regulator, positive regulator of tynA and feaB